MQSHMRALQKESWSPSSSKRILNAVSSRATTTGFRVGDLADKCKVPPNNNPPGKPGSALYRQDLIIYYTEWAPLKVIGGSNGTVRREAIGMSPGALRGGAVRTMRSWLCEKTP